MHIHRQGVSVGEVQEFSVPLDSTHSEKGIELVARKNEVILEGIGEKPRKKMVGMARFELATSAPPVGLKANDSVLMPYFTPVSKG